MTELAEFLNQRFVITIISILLGGYLLERIAERRARTQATQKKVLDYLEDIATRINSTITAIFRHLRFPESEDHDSNALVTELEELYRKRFTTQLVARLYLKNEEFSTRFELICKELRAVVDVLSNPNEIKAETAEDRRAQLEVRWPLAQEPHSYDDLDPPIREVAVWVDLVWKRAQSLMLAQTADTLRRRF